MPSEVIQQLRLEVAEDVRLARAERGQGMEPEDEEELAGVFAHRRVAAWHGEHAKRNPPLTRDQMAVLHEEVLNLTFRAGALQRLLDQPGVENIDIDGPVMFIDAAGQPRRTARSPFSDDRQTIDWVNAMAAQSGHGERQLSYSSPWVDFRLPDGSRVAANTLHSRVAVSIRRHSPSSSHLAKLMEYGTIDPLISAFLSACVKARMNVIVCGGMSAGKTTLLRALAREIPASERLVTIESDRELYLDTADTPAHVLAFEARQSNGELGEAGEVTIADLVKVALRYNADRVMVGEVRGAEAFAMLDAMLASNPGSMCTLHAQHPTQVINRLMLLLSMAGLPDTTSYRMIEGAVDIVVFLEKKPAAQHGQEGQRVVSHIWEVAGLGEGGGVAMNQLFAPRPEDGRAVPTQTPMSGARAEQLEREGGFDRRWRAHYYPDGMWSAPAVERRAS
ncbi:CpaF family protein [Streptomyces sp. MW-W600-10]|uniref:CpaF family protein n=1 Tax=Streptomyces sp. MW-W600-10 TaxID=2829819 RepID=UPI001C469AB8|nr:ATPase, T2SS/T4P/T4SS family [Streptomyces sp. MW-W600-10]MBV7249286.1 CpaF family protein [Streptomyces sp. MW-W600-10]